MRVHTGVLGWSVIILAAILVNSAFAGISQAIALLTRREATMIAIANFIGLPLLFLSTTMIARSQMPGWMQTAAKFNPVDWGVKAAREVVLPGTAWSSVGWYLLLLLGALGRHRRVGDVDVPRVPALALARVRRADHADRLAGGDGVAGCDRDGARRRRRRVRPPRSPSSSPRRCRGRRPASTVSPSATFTSSTVPCIGLTTAPEPPPAPPTPRARAGGARARGSRGSRTSTFTCTRRPSTSATVDALGRRAVERRRDRRLARELARSRCEELRLDEAVAGLAVDEAGVLEQRAVEADERSDAADLELAERAEHAAARGLAVRVVDDQLRDHRVVQRADLGARSDAGVDANAGAGRLAVDRDPARARQEAVRRILGVDPALDRVAAQDDVLLPQRQRLAGGDAHLLADQVEAR